MRQRGIAEEPGKFPPFAVDLRNQQIRLIWGVGSCQRLDHDTMLGLHAIEYARETTERLGHLEHPQRMSGRRHVDDDELESAVATGSSDFQQGCEFVNPGQRKLQQLRDVRPVQPRPAQGDLLERSPPDGKPSFERLARVDLYGVQRAAANGDSPGLCRQRAIERVAERWSWIGGDDERGGAARGGRYRD